MNSHRTFRRRRRVRHLALLAVVFYVCGLLANGLHFSLFRHEVCEHGDLVHVETGREACNHASGGEHVHDDRSGERSGELHEHCEIPASLASIPLALPVSAAALPIQVVARAPARAEVPRVEAIERLLIAPHHSPPTA